MAQLLCNVDPPRWQGMMNNFLIVEEEASGNRYIFIQKNTTDRTCQQRVTFKENRYCLGLNSLLEFLAFGAGFSVLVHIQAIRCGKRAQRIKYSQGLLKVRKSDGSIE